MHRGITKACGQDGTGGREGSAKWRDGPQQQGKVSPFVSQIWRRRGGMGEMRPALQLWSLDPAPSLREGELQVNGGERTRDMGSGSARVLAAPLSHL